MVNRAFFEIAIVLGEYITMTNRAFYEKKHYLNHYLLMANNYFLKNDYLNSLLNNNKPHFVANNDKI